MPRSAVLWTFCQRRRAMSVQVFPQEAVVAAPEVTPVLFDTEAERSTSYPLPSLQKSGPTEDRSVGLVVIANDRIRVTLCPDFGGRIVAWEDLTSGQAQIGMPSLVDLVDGGDQGLEWRHGIVWLPYGARLADLGPVHTEIRTPEDEGDTGGVVLSGASPSGAILWRLALALSPASDSLTLEGHVYHAAYSSLRLQSGLRVWNAPGLHVNSCQAFRWYEDDCARAALFPGFNAPARTGSMLRWQASIGPVMNPRKASAHSRIADAWADPQPGTVEADVATAIAAFGRDEEPDLPPEAESIPGLAGCLWGLRAMISARNQAWPDVIDACDHALETDARDQRLWWLRAVANRMLGGETDGPELPNAHYLWPSDPLLRAEGVLAAEVPEGRDPHPLLKSIKGDPGAMVDVAAHLCLLHLDVDLSRWVDECSRVQEVASLRYLLAYALLTRSRFEMQAAEYVVLAGRLPLAPPFPSRPIERVAIAALAKRFPNDKRLATLGGLMDWGQPTW